MKLWMFLEANCLFVYINNARIGRVYSDMDADRFDSDRHVRIETIYQQTYHMITEKITKAKTVK